MHSLKKKVILTSIIVLFALIATIGSTFAWFTLDSSSTVGDVQLEVGSDVSLLLLMDQNYDYVNNPAHKTFLDNPSNGFYVSNLTTAMIVAVYNYNLISFEPVTTTNGKNYLKNDRVTPASASPSAPGQYIEFSVWILSQTQNATVTIRNLEITANNTIIFKNIVADAVRMSIENQAGDVFIFGNDRDYLFTYREDQFGYDSVTPANNSIPALQKSTLEALHKIYYTTGTPIVGESTSSLTSADTVVSLTGNTPQKLTIRIWIEGWDEDANNNIMSAALRVKFDFAVQEVS